MHCWLINSLLYIYSWPEANFVWWHIVKHVNRMLAITKRRPQWLPFGNFQILASLESLVRSLPKVHRSVSEPTLNRSFMTSEETDCHTSPRTPMNTQLWGTFNFLTIGVNWWMCIGSLRRHWVWRIGVCAFITFLALGGVSFSRPQRCAVVSVSNADVNWTCLCCCCCRATALSYKSSFTNVDTHDVLCCTRWLISHLRTMFWYLNIVQMRWEHAMMRLLFFGVD